jgi:exodeoxyribonuclease-3
MTVIATAMRVLSWNVNGLRACARKGFGAWLSGSDAAIVAVQEVRASRAQLPPELADPPEWSAHFVEAERPGYSGVGLFSRVPIDAVETTLHEPRFDAEGRLQIATLGPLTVANVYFPNGNGQQRDNSRVPYKLDFYRRLFDRLEPLRRRCARVLVMGDFNTAHAPIDLARPRENHKTSGFLPEERGELARWLAAGWVDTFRSLHPDEAGHYTWWSQRQGARGRNVGWRIDYILASPAAANFLRGAAHHPDVLGSDHCPVSVTLDPAVLAADRGQDHERKEKIKN